MTALLFSSLIVLIVVVIVLIAPKIRSRIGSLITWKRSLILAGLYLGILIMSVPILHLLQNNGLIKLVENNNEDVIILPKAISDLENGLPLEGDLDKQQGLYRNSSHTFKADTNKVEIKLDANMNNYQIFVEQKDVEDGKVEVETYVGNQVASGIDLTKLISPPLITFQEGRLSLDSNDEQRLDFKQFKVDFTAEQLKDRNRVDGVGTVTDYGFVSGVKVIYIRVPKSLKIDKGMYSDGQIQMISAT